MAVVLPVMMAYGLASNLTYEIGNPDLKAERALGFDVGGYAMRVSDRFGTVVTVEGAADKAVASIDFGSDGVKRLLLRYAPVEKL